MKGARTDFHVQRLKDNTALLGPELLKSEDEPLEGVQIGCFIHVYALLPVT